MPRPVTLFTGQWADLPFEEVCRLAGDWGYDGLEIACWGDHLDVVRAVEDDAYLAAKQELLAKHDLQVFAISNHLVGQAVCDDPIDERHRGILPARLWGDGEPEGVRRRAAEEMADTARAAAELGVEPVVGFTGSKIWKTVAMFPPVPQSMVDEGYQDFADRWNPVLDVFDEVGVRFAHEIADFVEDIAAGRAPSPSFDDGLQVQRVLEAVEQSAAKDSLWTPVPTPPEPARRPEER